MGGILNIAPESCGCEACARRREDSGRGFSGRSFALDRRAVLFAAAGASVTWTSGLAPTRARAQAPATSSPDAALDRLMAGNRRYVAGDMTSYKEDLALQKARTVENQEPFAAVLSCADSRVPVEIVFDQSIGKLFVTRVAGNIATTAIIASLEYGAAVLGTSVIMVLGHQGCGAVKAAVGGQAVPGQISALYASLRPAVEQGHHDYEATSKINAKMQADLLATASPVLADLAEKGRLKIVAAYYSLETGAISLL